MHNIYISQSIRNHDQGKKHVEIVAEFFRKKREDKLKGAQSESDLKRQMDKIEKVKGGGRTLSLRLQVQEVASGCGSAVSGRREWHPCPVANLEQYRPGPTGLCWLLCSPAL